MHADVAFAEIDPDDYAGIMFSGGRAPEYIRYDEDLVRVTKHFFETNKPVASVCHGVEIPAYADCVRGRRMATVPKCKFDLEVCGGTLSTKPAWSTATWSAVEPFTTMAITLANGSICWSKPAPLSQPRPKLGAAVKMAILGIAHDHDRRL